MFDKLTVEELAAHEDTLATTYEPLADEADEATLLGIMFAGVLSPELAEVLDETADTVRCPPWWEAEDDDLPF